MLRLFRRGFQLQPDLQFLPQSECFVALFFLGILPFPVFTLLHETAASGFVGWLSAKFEPFADCFISAAVDVSDCECILSCPFPSLFIT